MRAHAVFAALLLACVVLASADEARIYKVSAEASSMDLLEAGVASPRYVSRYDREDEIPDRRDRGQSRFPARNRTSEEDEDQANNSTRGGNSDRDEFRAEDDQFTYAYQRVRDSGDDRFVRGLLDNRKYHSMHLDNGLEVLLVSDPDTPKAAASMDVGVGYFQDDIAGTAHFLEHMLFLGSAKYPVENDFENYIQSHGGSNNAYTSMENTNFYFDILPSDLEGGLDRFAQFFISPSLGTDGAAREMNAVNSEHRKNIENDGWRSTQIKRYVASKSSPYSKFGTGSQETLGQHSKEELQTKLKALWTAHYTAANMRLVVLGAHSLRELARWVENSFAPVRPTPVGGNIISRDANHTSTHKTVYDQALKMRTVYYAPVRRIRTLTMQWAIPPTAYNYTTNEDKYLSLLFEADGQGTLHSQLRKKGWIKGINAGVGVTASTFSLFQVEISLTARGMKYVDQIIESVFQTINRIKKRGVSRWRYQEAARLARVQFNWKGKERPMSFVSDVAARMRWFRKEHWVSGNNLFYRFSRRRINLMLDSLTPQDVVIFQSAKSLAKTRNLDQTEPYYGIKFTVGPANPDNMHIWAIDAKRTYLFGTPRRSATLRLPEPNKWIPSQTTLAVKPWYDMRNNTFMRDVSVNSSVHIAPPMVIFESERPAARVWFRQDAKFNRPVVHASIRVWVAGLQSSPRASALTLLYTQLVNDLLQDWAFPASNAGYDYTIRPDREGLTITMVGYSENLESFFKSIAFRLSGEGFRPTLDRFHIIRESALEALANQRFRAPYKYARSLVRLALGEAHPISEVAAALNTLTLEDVKAWPEFIYSDARMEAFFNGNVYPWEARAFAKTARDLLKFKTISTSFTEAHRQIQSWKSRRPLLDGRYTISTPSLDKNEPNSMVYALYQAGSGNTMDRLYMQLLDQYLHKPAYNQLRTKEQLGYIVWSIGATTSDVPELAVQVQTTGFAPKYVNARIQTFLTKFREDLQRKMNARKFAKHVMTMYETKMVNATTLMEETKADWSAILSQRYNFLQRFKDARLLLTKVTLGGFLKFVDRVLGFGKYSGASMTFEVYAPGQDTVALAPAPEKFGAHEFLPAPLPVNSYTDRLRKLATHRAMQSLHREGKLSEYLRQNHTFRTSPAGREILAELLRRRSKREMLNRNVLQHLERNSVMGISKTWTAKKFTKVCEQKCKIVAEGPHRSRCQTACLTREIREFRIKGIKEREVKCVAECNKETEHARRYDPYSDQARMTPELCGSACKNKSDNAVKQLEEAERRAKRNVAVTERALKNSSNQWDEDKMNTKDPVDTVPAVRTPVEGQPPVQAPAAPGVAFLELDTEVEAQAQTETESESEAEAEYRGESQVDADMDALDESAENDIDSFAETESETEAHSDLRKKVTLLEALEREAFEAGMKLRRQGREAFMAQSLAEALPTEVYKEEGDEHYSKAGYDKFEEIADPREEMREYGRNKEAIADVRDSVAARYANITEDSGSRFHYDGADTDAPVVMFISYSPTANVTRKLSVAALGSLRHTLYLAPLRVKTTVPELVPVPRSAPANATTV